MPCLDAPSICGRCTTRWSRNASSLNKYTIYSPSACWLTIWKLLCRTWLHSCSVSASPQPSERLHRPAQIKRLSIFYIRSCYLKDDKLKSSSEPERCTASPSWGLLLTGDTKKDISPFQKKTFRKLPNSEPCLSQHRNSPMVKSFSMQSVELFSQG